MLTKLFPKVFDKYLSQPLFGPVIDGLSLGWRSKATRAVLANAWSIRWSAGIGSTSKFFRASGGFWLLPVPQFDKLLPLGKIGFPLYKIALQ